MIVAWATTSLSGESYKQTQGYNLRGAESGRHTVLFFFGFHFPLYHLLLDWSPPQPINLAHSFFPKQAQGSHINFFSFTFCVRKEVMFKLTLEE